MNDKSKEDHLGKNKFGCTFFTELRGRDTRALPRIFRLFWIPPKNPYLNQATPQKNTCQIFLPKKIPESKISNPKKSFDHPRQLKSGVPPTPGPIS